MKCSRIERKLSAYLDGEMPEQKRAVISEHLKQCEGCRAKLSGFRAIADALDTIEDMEAPPYFTTRLRQRLTEQKRTLPLLQRIRSLAVTAATTVAVVGSLFIGNQAGRILYQSITLIREPVMSETSEVFGLGAFEEFPDGSLSDIYNELITGGNNG